MANTYYFAVFFTAALGFIVSVILIFANKSDTFSARLLAAFLLTFSLFALNYNLLITGGFQSVPHLWKAFVWLSFLYMPFSYLYVRTVLRQSFRLERWDFLLFLPAFVFTASYIPFYLQDAAAKLAYMEQVKTHPYYLTMEPDSVLPPWTGYAMRILLGIGCVSGQFVLLYRWKRQNQSLIGAEAQNREVYRWLFLFTLLMAIFYLLVVVQFVLQGQMGSGVNVILISTIIGTIFFVCLSLLFKPSILYGIRGWVSPPPADEKMQHTETPGLHEVEMVERKKSFLSPEQGKLMKDTLEAHFAANRPFLRIGYSISQLSQELKIPSYQISAFINQEYGKNFNELVNEYRVRFLIDRYQGDSYVSQFTLEAIGKEVGFNSRAAFISAVRKVTGETPSRILGRRDKDAGL